MKNRQYHYFFEDNKHTSDAEINIEGVGTLQYKTLPLESSDRYKDDLSLFAFPIKYLYHVNHLLSLFDLNGDLDYFFSQCKEVIAVPEKHQNEKGTEGKMNFQVYFHDVPHSLASINDNAIVVMSLAPNDTKNDKGQKNYKLAGYVHANEFQFADTVGSDLKHNAYYYNMLRISEEERDGKQIYRRTGVFALMFTILLDLVNQNDVHFVYAAMGKENQKINSALKKLAENFDKKWDILPITSNSTVNWLYGRKRYAKQLVDITHNKEKLEELFNKSQEHRGNYMFNQYPDFEEFYHFYKRIVDYSKTSGAYMIADEQGNMLAATVAINWGDYFAFRLDNPKGIFKLLAKLELTEKLLYMWMTVGTPKAVEKLYRGLAYKYLKEQNVKLSLMNSYQGDNFADLKSSIINDPFNYFVIYDRPEMYQKFQDYSKDKDGNIRIFIDTPVF